MDFNKSISIATGTSTSALLNLNSITSAPAVGTLFSGYIIESVSYANGPIVGFTDPLAQRDGLDTDIALLPMRQTQLIVQVYGSSSNDFYDKIDAMNAALQPYPDFASSTDGFRNLDFRQPTGIAEYTANGIPMRLSVRPVAIPSYNLNNDLVTPRTSDRGLTTRASIGLMSKDPRKICQTAKTGSIALTSGSATTSLTNSGNYYAYPTFTIVSNLTTASTLTISTSLWTTALSISTGAKTTALNSLARTVTSNGSLLMSSLGSTTTELPYLASGANSITFAFSGGGAFPSSISYSYQEAWL